ncbi:hypothetical protein AAFF_G00163350 [Aldrovandia affinis]|uniref:Uncharacterized protein n=1 Tax=Aldrovandia affinis TaxID=143900 RepID=A0AAD7SZ98_9TELE|nr:hypothetical protein AAFF_G00163350 [Aldrovandia affinis]
MALSVGSLRYRRFGSRGGGYLITPGQCVYGQCAGAQALFENPKIMVPSSGLGFGGKIAASATLHQERTSCSLALMCGADGTRAAPCCRVQGRTVSRIKGTASLRRAARPAELWENVHRWWGSALNGVQMFPLAPIGWEWEVRPARLPLRALGAAGLSQGLVQVSGGALTRHARESRGRNMATAVRQASEQLILSAVQRRGSPPPRAADLLSHCIHDSRPHGRRGKQCPQLMSGVKQQPRAMRDSALKVFLLSDAETQYPGCCGTAMFPHVQEQRGVLRVLPDINKIKGQAQRTAGGRRMCEVYGKHCLGIACISWDPEEDGTLNPSHPQGPGCLCLSHGLHASAALNLSVCKLGRRVCFSL